MAFVFESQAKFGIVDKSLINIKLIIKMQYVWSLLIFRAVNQWIRLTFLFILIVFWAQKLQNILFWTF
jgi:hypothetical protein